MKKGILLLAWLFVVSVPLFGESVYTVTDTVRLEHPSRFGINYETGPFVPWGRTTWNCWNSMYSFEPITFRLTIQATGGDSDYLESRRGEPSGTHSGSKTRSVGTGHWSQYPDGFFDGAQARIYRVEEGMPELIRTDTVKTFYSNKGGEERIYFEDRGEEIEKGDLCDLLMTRLAPPMASLLQLPTPSRAHNLYYGSMYPVTASRSTKNTRVEGLDAVLDDSTFAPEGDSTASLKLTLPGSSGEAVGLGHQFANKQASNLLPVGKTFRVEAWMKQKGLGGPAVLQAGGYGAKEFDVSKDWKKYSFEFQTTEAVPALRSFMVGSAADGTLWVDNLLCYQTDVEPFAIYPEVVEDLKVLNPGGLRSMSGRSLLSLDALLTRGFSRKPGYSHASGPGSSGVGGANFSLGEHLRLCRDIGADPWIMTYILWSDEEIEKFMEYLGAPADVGYGKLRAQHGQITPWTEEFDNIYVECANEMWNPNFAPQAFAEDPELCGQLSERLISRAKTSRWNTRKTIRGICPATTIRGICSKWVDSSGTGHGKGWSYRAAENCPSFDTLGSAPSGYIGGWDSIALESKSLMDSLHNNLFFSARIYEPALKEFEQLQEALDKKFSMFLYEAGPGYPLPNAKVPFTEEVEQVNKSLAMGVASLDSFMFVIANNGNMNYFLYGRGPNWTTHNDNGDPHTTYLAMLLRNRYAKGALMEVEEGVQDTKSLPAMKYNKFGANNKAAKNVLPAISDVPLTRLFAFTEGKRHSYVLLNRSLTEPQTVTIQLPYNPAAEYTEYLLTHSDPAANNRTAYNVKIQENKKTGFSRNFSYTIPPASAVTLVNEEL